MASNIITSLDGQATPGGSGSGNKNYLSTYTASTSNGVANVGNGNFELASVDGWSLAHSTLSGVFPTDVASAGDAFSSTSGGSAADITLSLTLLSGGNQIAANYSADLASSGVSIPGDLLISDAFFIDEQDQAKVMTIQFYYRAQSGSADLDFSGTSSNSYAVWIYDVTNGAWIQPAGVYGMTQGTGVGYFTGTFQTTSNSTQYQLALININASTGAFDLYVDDFLIGPQTAPFGPVVTDWQPYDLVIGATTTPPTLGTTVVNLALWRRVGDSMEVIYTVEQSSGGSAGSGDYLFPIPSGYSIDLAKLPANGSGFHGIAGGATGAWTFAGTTFSIHGDVITYDSSYLAIQLEAQFDGIAGTINNALGLLQSASGFIDATTSNGTLTFQIQVPIVGWSSNVEMSNSTDTRVVALKVSLSTNQMVSTDTPILFDVIEVDTHGTYNPATGQSTIAVSGLYRCSLGAQPTGAVASNVSVFVNGAAITALASTTAAQQDGGSTLIYVEAGNVVEIRPELTTTFISGIYTNWAMERLSGPSVIAATETVSLRYTSANNATYNNGDVLKFEIKDYDDHDLYDVTTGIAMIPISGKYEINVKTFIGGTIRTVGDQFILAIQKGGVTQFQGPVYDVIVTLSQTLALSTGATLRLLAGDQITIISNSSAAIALAADATTNEFELIRVGNY